MIYVRYVPLGTFLKKDKENLGRSCVQKTKKALPLLHLSFVAFQRDFAGISARDYGNLQFEFLCVHTQFKHL